MDCQHKKTSNYLLNSRFISFARNASILKHSQVSTFLIPRKYCFKYITHVILFLRWLRKFFGIKTFFLEFLLIVVKWLNTRNLNHFECGGLFLKLIQFFLNTLKHSIPFLTFHFFLHPNYIKTEFETIRNSNSEVREHESHED